MNKLIVILIMLLFAAPLAALDQPLQEAVQEQEPAAGQAPEEQAEPKQDIQRVSAKDARLHAGETLAVCGVVATGVYDRRSQQKNTYLNFDKPYPDNTFTAVIHRKNRKYFDYKPEKLEGQFICVYGMVSVFGGRPEINVIIPKQIAAKEFPK